MGFDYKSIVNVTGRILLYLLKFQLSEESSLSPNQLTAEAIADAVITDRNNISHYIRLLKSDKLIDSVSTRVKGKKRKQSPIEVKKKYTLPDKKENGKQ